MSAGRQHGFTAVNGRFLPEKRSNERAELEGKPVRNNFFRFPTPESVLKSFNTRSFKREQPEKPELMLELAAQAIARGEPLSFVMYWGKGPRAYLGAPDVTCLDFITSMTTRIRQVLAAGARVHLVFTDTHAGINGHSQHSIASYFEDLTAGARHRGFDTCLLSDLVDNNPVPVLPEATRDDITDELFAALCESASKWFRGSGTIEQGALRYYQANMVEKRVIERAFPNSIFVTFNGSEMRRLFPDRLSIFYMYSLRHGVCAKPWFLPSDFNYHPHAADAARLEAAHGA